MKHPLRYKICRWPQAAKCLSNNSRNLYITTSEFVNNDSLEGLIIKVEHSEFGTLFAAIVQGEGELVSKYDDDDGKLLPWMSTQDILAQLRKFGFDIYYDEPSSLDDATLDYIMQIRDAGFDKITKLAVISRKNGSRTTKTYTVGIKTKGNEDLLVFGTPVTETKFNNRLSAGKMISLEDTDLKWDWLTSIYNIDDLLEENSDIEFMETSELQQDLVEDTPMIAQPEGFTLYDESIEETNDESEP